MERGRRTDEESGERRRWGRRRSRSTDNGDTMSALLANLNWWVADGAVDFPTVLPSV